MMSILLISAIQGCDVVRQARQASALAKCDFKINAVTEVSLAGVELVNIKSVSDLNIGDMARLMSGLTSPVFPLDLQLIIEGHNPNDKEAGLNRLEWILFIDEIQMTSGIIEQPFVIPPKSNLNIPVAVTVDIKQVLTGKSANAMLNFCMNLAGVGKKPTRFKIKLKPTVVIAGEPIKYPGFITVNTEYGPKE